MSVFADWCNDGLFWLIFYLDFIGICQRNFPSLLSEFFHIFVFFFFFFFCRWSCYDGFLFLVPSLGRFFLWWVSTMWSVCFCHFFQIWLSTLVNILFLLFFHVLFYQIFLFLSLLGFRGCLALINIYTWGNDQHSRDLVVTKPCQMLFGMTLFFSFLFSNYTRKWVSRSTLYLSFIWTIWVT